MSKSEVRVEFQLSRDDGFLAIYARFRKGKVHTTFEISRGLNADVDREGVVLGVEVIRTFSARRKKRSMAGVIDLNKIQSAVEKRFSTSMQEEFEAIREATAAMS